MAPAAPMPHMFYLSDILGHAVFDAADRKVGVLHDVAAYMGPSFPVVTKIRVRTRREASGKRRLVYVDWSEVLGMEGPNLILKAGTARPRSPNCTSASCSCGRTSSTSRWWTSPAARSCGSTT